MFARANQRPSPPWLKERTMLLEFFKFDLRYQLKQPLLWLTGLILGALAFGATTSDAIQVGGAIGNVHRNAPVVIANMMGMFTVIAMFIVTMFIAGAVLRDSEVGISDMLFATPMRKHQYLIGRFGAGMAACLVIFLLIAVGLMLGPLMPWVDVNRVGVFSLMPYLWGFAVLVIPNLLFIGALLMLLAATTRSIMLVYVGVVGFFVLQVVAETLTSNINNEWIAVMLDPFGIGAFERMTRYFTASESNTMLPPVSGFLLANRILWSVVALVLFSATIVLFKPQRAGTSRRLFGKAKAIAAPAAERAAPRQRATATAPRFSAATAWTQCWHLICFDAKFVFKSVPFLIFLLIAVMNFIAGASMSGEMFGTKVMPVTHIMLQVMSGSLSIFLIIVLVFYAGELIFRERQLKISDVVDAMPVPNWVPLVAKSLALVGVTFGFMFAGALAAICFQLVKGGAPVELSLYASGILFNSMTFLLMGLCALVLQILTNNKFAGYLLMIVLLVAKIAIPGAFNLEHNLYNFAALPGLRYSDMNGYGHLVEGWAWFAAYWSLFTLALLIVAQAFWARGLVPTGRARMKLAAQRLRGRTGLALALCLTAFAGTGGWIFYNTNVLNTYMSSDVDLDQLANYEKLYGKYKGLPHPRITDVRADVDIYPAERRIAIKGQYLLQNKSDAPMDTLRLQVNPQLKTKWKNLPQHTVVVDDKDLGFSVLTLAKPLAAGESLALAFDVDVVHQGFTNRNAPNQVNLNGTFFNNGEFFPHFGYQDRIEIQDRNERRKRGMGEPVRVAKLEDSSAYANHQLGGEADWINFETTVSTSADQTAMAPGYLQKTWAKDGRRYFHYKMDRPMMPFFAYMSARYEVKKADWKGLPIEIYYDKKHAYNVDRMVESTQKSLDYFGENFGPYQHKQVRILEFPNYERFAQAFANTIPYSESMGFIADLRNKDDIDHVFFVTAHEMAHQWWAHQVVGANVQGATMLVESLAEYSALMVMRKEYGPEKLRRFLRFELDRYLSDRGSELIEEQPLYRVENQQYIHYRKGSLVFYRLADEIGEENVNRALKNFIKDRAFKGAPYPTSKDLLAYIRAEAPQDKQALITDLFEKIVFYDNRVTEAKAVKRKDGQWDVTMKLHLAKLQADGKGKETPRAYDEPVEIAIFARAKGAKEKDETVLFNAKRVLAGSDPVVTITVKEQPFEVGVDPYNKMIDRVVRDNRKEVSID
jgi:ABC-2 type transport system permease protein